jgi:predicted RNase H-like HicB family nuclease
MQIPVMVEPQADGRYVAKACSPFDWSADGATADEAMTRLREHADRMFAIGVQATSLDLFNPDLAEDNPILCESGRMPDDEITAQWWQEVLEYRRQCDDDPDRR